MRPSIVFFERRRCGGGVFAMHVIVVACAAFTFAARRVDANAFGTSFIRTDGRRFLVGDGDDDDARVVFRGFNAYGLTELASEMTTRRGSFGFDAANADGRAMASKAMRSARDAGMNVARTWAFSVHGDREDFTDEERERVMIGVDWIVAEAERLGVYVVLALSDYFHNDDKAACVVGMTNDSDDDSDDDATFFSREECRRVYKERVGKILTRKNAMKGGREYRDDGTIAAWNLINEPRCRGCGDALQRWIDEMAAFVKSIDPNHMLTIGEEGFYAADSPSENVDANPAAWAATTGQDFVRNHASPHIDYVTCHLWKDNWGVYAPSVAMNSERFTREWIRAHEQDAKLLLGKPLVVEEFGAAPGGARALTRAADNSGRRTVIARVATPRNERQVATYYRNVFSQVYRSAVDDRDGYIQGALFWVYWPEEMRPFVNAYDPYAVYPSDRAFAEASRFSESVARAIDGRSVAREPIQEYY